MTLASFRQIIMFIISLIIFFVFGTSLAYAQGGNPPTGGGNPSIGVSIGNPFSNADSLFELFQIIVNDILIPIGAVVVVMAFIWTGFLYVTAQGNETKIKTAHRSLLYSAIGAAVLLGAWVLANAICRTMQLIGAAVSCG